MKIVGKHFLNYCSSVHGEKGDLNGGGHSKVHILFRGESKVDVGEECVKYPKIFWTTFMNVQTWISSKRIQRIFVWPGVIRTKTKLRKQLKFVNSIVKRRQWTILNRSPVFFLPKALWFSPLAPTSKASGNVFPILLPFSFGKSDWGKRVAASSKNNLGQTFAQTHTQNHTLPRGRCLRPT